MSDYGIKSGKRGVSITEATGADILMSTKYPFAKIDQTKSDTFRTTTVTLLSDTTDNTQVEIASFEHGYDYRPQVWGLWNVTWGPSITGTPNLEQNGYGALTNTSGIPASTIHYEWDTTSIYLYLTKGSSGSSDATGTVATLTTYVFADDMTEQSY